MSSDSLKMGMSGNYTNQSQLLHPFQIFFTPLSMIFVNQFNDLILMILKLIEETTFNPTYDTTLGITWRTTEITTERENFETIWIVENPELTTLTSMTSTTTTTTTKTTTSTTTTNTTTTTTTTTTRTFIAFVPLKSSAIIKNNRVSLNSRFLWKTL